MPEEAQLENECKVLKTTQGRSHTNSDKSQGHQKYIPCRNI